MTTIAYRDGLMACDSAWSDGYTLFTRQSKIVRLPSGGLLGSAGDADCRAIEELIGKVKTVAGLPTRKALLDLQIDYNGILVLPKGKIIFVASEFKDGKWGGGFMEVSESFFATGSGDEFALGAMECGRSAKDAVNIAIRRNMTCRAPVHVIALVQPEKKKARKK